MINWLSADELNKIGQTFSERENLQGALFIYVSFQVFLIQSTNIAVDLDRNSKMRLI